MIYDILLMGASYGSLLASKLLFGGHSIHLVCLPPEADLINAEGFKVRLPIRGHKDPVVLESRKLPGKVTAGPATGINPKNYDLVGLAMQEPQYRSPDVSLSQDSGAKLAGDGQRPSQRDRYGDPGHLPLVLHARALCGETGLH